MPSNDTSQLLAVGAGKLAAMLDVSKRHIERLDAAGRIPPPVRIGKSKRWRVRDIDHWLQAGCPDRDAWLAGQGGTDHAT